MEIALIIVAGVVIVTAITGVFDYLGKRRKATGGVEARRVEALEARVAGLETKVTERDERIAQLETEIQFVNRLIEDKRK